MLLNQEVRIINVPKLNELTVASLIYQVKNDEVVRRYLPKIEDKRSVNRQFLYNVSIYIFKLKTLIKIINTLKPEFFPMNIKEGLQKRKDLKSIGKNKFVQIQSDMYDLLANAVNLNPSTRGRALHLLNHGAKTRKRPERPQNNFTSPSFSLG